MFRSWWQSLTTRTPKAPRPRRRSWLRLARLEDRTTPAVTAGLVGSRLEVHLGDTGDVANLQVVGSKIRVSDAGGVKLDVLASGVSNIDVTGDLAKSGQAVNLQSALSLIGTLSVTGVQSIDLQGALTASRGLVLNSTGGSRH